jgi:hypothetical protein
MTPIDPVKQAEELAQIFYNLSNAVDDFRLRPANYATLSPADQERLKGQAQALASRAQQCTADAMGAILRGIQAHLANIKQATQAAQDALGRLSDVAKGIAIVDSAVALVASIASGNLGSVGDSVQGLYQAISG